MAETRRATVSDAEAIGEQRVRMFVDDGVADRGNMAQMRANFVEWVRPKLEDGRLVAGAGLWEMEWPPHFMDEDSRRAYLLNFYVAPEMRQRGLARMLLGLAVAEAKSRGIKVVTLHASKLGRLVYEQGGFKASTEMMLRP
jgi:ribosomal protein S18 acetylase RimI-like enzyme